MENTNVTLTDVVVNTCNSTARALQGAAEATGSFIRTHDGVFALAEEVSNRCAGVGATVFVVGGAIRAIPIPAVRQVGSTIMLVGGLSWVGYSMQRDMFSLVRGLAADAAPSPSAKEPEEKQAEPSVSLNEDGRVMAIGFSLS